MGLSDLNQPMCWASASCLRMVHGTYFHNHSPTKLTVLPAVVQARAFRSVVDTCQQQSVADCIALQLLPSPFGRAGASTLLSLRKAIAAKQLSSCGSMAPHSRVVSSEHDRLKHVLLALCASSWACEAYVAVSSTIAFRILRHLQIQVTVPAFLLVVMRV